MSLHGRECLLVKRPWALLKTLVNIDLQLWRNGNNCATWRARLFIPILAPTLSKSCLLKSKRHCLKYRGKNTDPVIHNIFHKYFMNPFTRLKPVRQKKKTLSPILVPACQHITGEWVSHVTSSLRDCEGQARCAEFGGRTERRTEGKVKGRWKKGSKERGGGGGRGGMGCYHIIAPMSLYFPLIICGPRSLQSLNHTSPEDSEGTWEGLLSQTGVWKLSWSLSLCRCTATSEGPGEISGRGNDRVQG